MKETKPKTVRFADLVEAFGHPEIITLWSDPKADPGFKKAVQSNRVLTVAQVNVGTKKDFGLVGFHQREHASYLVFPRPLSYGAGTKVVGIKYDLVASPSVKDPIGNFAAKKKPKAAEPKGTERKKPKRERFSVTVEVTACKEVLVEVEAKDEKEARARATEMVAAQNFDLSTAIMKRRVLNSRKMEDRSL